VCEAAGAVGVLLPATRPVAAAALTLLLIAVFPANVVDARTKGAADASFARRIVVRGAEQLCFVALCIWILVAAALS
ncbi:MAG: DoxX family protein, partial [Microbacterium sp.]